MKADQKASRYLGGSVPFGCRLSGDSELRPHDAEQEAIREMIAMKAQGLSLRAIAAEMQAKGHQISHVGVQSVLKAAGLREGCFSLMVEFGAEGRRVGKAAQCDPHHRASSG